MLLIGVMKKRKEQKDLKVKLIITLLLSLFSALTLGHEFARGIGMSLEELNRTPEYKKMIMEDQGELREVYIEVDEAIIENGHLKLLTRFNGGRGLHKITVEKEDCDSNQECVLKVTHLSNDIFEMGDAEVLSISIDELGIKEDIDLGKRFVIKGKKPFWKDGDDPEFILNLDEASGDSQSSGAVAQ